MATAEQETTVPATEETARPKPHEQLPTIAGPRLPYHPAVQERFGIDKASWIALVDAIYPGATSTESVILALSYCRARKLDPFKKPVHIVPIWSKDRNCYVDTVWPGIGELRTTAFRTGEYAGRGETTYGPDLTQKFKGTVGSRGKERTVEVEIVFPEWAQVTVYRMVKDQRVAFAGPRVYWTETYATLGKSDVPNDMWCGRPRGQIDKCAEAAALRSAFPEEIGGDMIPDEVQHVKRGEVIEQAAATAPHKLADLTEQLKASQGFDTAPTRETVPAETQEQAPEETTHDEPEQSYTCLDGCESEYAACETLGETEACTKAIAKARGIKIDDPEYPTLLDMEDARKKEIRAHRGTRSNTAPDIVDQFEAACKKCTDIGEITMIYETLLESNELDAAQLKRASAIQTAAKAALKAKS